DERVMPSMTDERPLEVLVGYGEMVRTQAPAWLSDEESLWWVMPVTPSLRLHGVRQGHGVERVQQPAQARVLLGQGRCCACGRRKRLDLAERRSDRVGYNDPRGSGRRRAARTLLPAEETECRRRRGRDGRVRRVTTAPQLEFKALLTALHGPGVVGGEGRFEQPAQLPQQR